MAAGRFFIIIAVVCLMSIALTLLAGKVFSKGRIYKYIPALIELVLAVIFFIRAKFFYEGFQDIAYILLSVVSGIAFIASLCTAIVIDIIKRKN